MHHGHELEALNIAGQAVMAGTFKTRLHLAVEQMERDAAHSIGHLLDEVLNRKHHKLLGCGAHGLDLCGAEMKRHAFHLHWVLIP